jgi:flotillin
MLPALVEAASRSIQGSHLTVLNGSSGVNDVATGLIAQGLSIYNTLRTSIADESASIAQPAPDGKQPADTA